MKKIIFLSMVLLLLFFNGCTYTQKTEQTKELMGTFVTITIYNEEEAKAEKAIDKAFKEIQRIESILSSYINTSEVYQLNKNSKITNASNELVYVLGKSLRYGDMSRGAFDITVQPILDLYKKSFQELKRPPTDEEIKEIKELIGYEKIHTRNNNIQLKQNMKITLGGIAKGYAIDRAIKTLKNRGIKHALVNAGGDMRAIGSKGNQQWQIALQNPRKKKEHITIIPINNTAVATSGDYERFFDENKKFHHIVDPRTGYSATELISVTIIAKTALEADALATSVLVLGKEGINLIENQDNVEGLIITKDKKIIKSSGFEKI